MAEKKPSDETPEEAETADEPQEDLQHVPVSSPPEPPDTEGL